jgi:hypothetical protein
MMITVINAVLTRQELVALQLMATSASQTILPLVTMILIVIVLVA